MAGPKDEDALSDAEIAAREEATLRKLLATPHKPHSATKATPKRASGKQ